MDNFEKLFREDFPTYYQYRKAISRYRQSGYIIRIVGGGVFCFPDVCSFEYWVNQR